MLQCHSGTQQAAIEDTTGTATGTSFPLHGFHLKEHRRRRQRRHRHHVPGAGQGNALCAECHYNLHATAVDARGLVKFAPDVESYNGLPIAYDATTGTCTLTCHGVAHGADGVPAPAAVVAPLAPAAIATPVPSTAPTAGADDRPLTASPVSTGTGSAPISPPSSPPGSRPKCAARRMGSRAPAPDNSLQVSSRGPPRHGLREPR